MKFYKDLLDELGHGDCDDSCTKKAMLEDFLDNYEYTLLVSERQRIEDALVQTFQKHSMSTKLKVDIYNSVWPKGGEQE